MILIDELECRERLYLKRAAESDQMANAAIDHAEHRAWKRIAASWRSLATKARSTAELLGERNIRPPMEIEPSETGPTEGSPAP